MGPRSATSPALERFLVWEGIVEIHEQEEEREERLLAYQDLGWRHHCAWCNPHEYGDHWEPASRDEISTYEVVAKIGAGLDEAELQAALELLPAWKRSVEELADFARLAAALGPEATEAVIVMLPDWEGTAEELVRAAELLS